MFFASVFIRTLFFFCCTSSLSQSFKEDGAIKKRAKRQLYKDINHPGNLIHVHGLQWYHCEMEDGVQKKISECKTIETHLVPEQLEPKELESFYSNYQDWWALFKYSKSPIIRKLKGDVQNLVHIIKDEEKASLMAYLNCELCRIFKQKIVYQKSVCVNESDVESVIEALQVWGMKDRKLLNAARAVHGVWDGTYSRDSVVWPQNFENGTESSLS